MIYTITVLAFQSKLGRLIRSKLYQNTCVGKMVLAKLPPIVRALLVLSSISFLVFILILLITLWQEVSVYTKKTSSGEYVRKIVFSILQLDIAVMTSVSVSSSSKRRKKNVGKSVRVLLKRYLILNGREYEYKKFVQEAGNESALEDSIIKKCPDLKMFFTNDILSPKQLKQQCEELEFMDNLHSLEAIENIFNSPHFLKYAANISKSGEDFNSLESLGNLDEDENSTIASTYIPSLPEAVYVAKEDTDMSFERSDNTSVSSLDNEGNNVLVGSKVESFGFPEGSGLNGLKGIALSFDSLTGRYYFENESKNGDKIMSFHKRNLKRTSLLDIILTRPSYPGTKMYWDTIDKYRSQYLNQKDNLSGKKEILEEVWQEINSYGQLLTREGKMMNDEEVKEKIVKNLKEGKSTSRRKESEVRQYIIGDPTENDIIAERGGRSNFHSGNQKYLELVSEYQNAYSTIGNISTKNNNMKKNEIVSKIYRIIKMEWNGRFLIPDNKTDPNNVLFYEMNEKDATDKIKQKLRDFSKKSKSSST